MSRAIVSIIRATFFLGLSSLGKFPCTWHSVHITPRAVLKDSMTSRSSMPFNCKIFKFCGLSKGLGPFFFFSSWANRAKPAMSTTVSTFSKRMGISYVAVLGKSKGILEIFRKKEGRRSLKIRSKKIEVTAQVRLRYVVEEQPAIAPVIVTWRRCKCGEAPGNDLVGHG